ncbi:MAG: hypothetical protein H7X89_03825 [Rhizobiales bacterium]|nr:hypothetical protein [Hyphomicrobiales bacterium]
MNTYRIYEFNSQNHIQKRHDLAAPDDVTALEQAKALASKTTLEIWENARLIARVGHDGEAAP